MTLFVICNFFHVTHQFPPPLNTVTLWIKMLPVGFGDLFLVILDDEVTVRRSGLDFTLVSVTESVSPAIGVSTVLRIEGRDFGVPLILCLKLPPFRTFCNKKISYNYFTNIRITLYLQQ